MTKLPGEIILTRQEHFRKIAQQTKTPAGAKRRQQRLEKMAAMLARLYRQENYMDGPCACSGFGCGNRACYHWWMSFLMMDKERVRKMVDLYEVATR